MESHHSIELELIHAHVHNTSHNLINVYQLGCVILDVAHIMARSTFHVPLDKLHSISPHHK